MSPDPNHAINADKLARQAVVYIRQSSQGQVIKNTESARVQRNLRQKAIELGWNQPCVIDDDLGVSASGFAVRPGFQDLLARVANRQVGIILSVDASRLSRNSKDWAHLLDLCSCCETLIADADQVYDLANLNDRMILGIKGTVSELELGTIRRRMRDGTQSKAARGKLRFLLPVGYVHDANGEPVLDPDKRVRESVLQMFARFEEHSSVRQLSIWYRDSGTLFPHRSRHKGQPTRWAIPSSGKLTTLLCHPFLAGAYVYGRKVTTVECVDGQLSKRVKRRETPQVCIHDNHPSYISWERHLEICAQVSDNAAMWKNQENRGAPREGLALLTGLIRCGCCGRKVQVTYTTKTSAIYRCPGGNDVGDRGCISIASVGVDALVSDELCRALQPHAVNAAITAASMREEARSKDVESARLHVEAAQYEADRAFEQFNLCDPRNRNVADTLEQRLNDRLIELEAARQRHQEQLADDTKSSEETTEQLARLSRDFSAVWDHPDADPRFKKQLLRAAITEIIVEPIDEPRRIQVTVHWQGGTHTRAHVARRPRKGTPSPKTEELMSLVEKLAVEHTDAEISRVLSLNGHKTAIGLNWNQARVRSFRNRNGIRAPKVGAESRTLTRSQARQYLGIGGSAITALVERGLITPNQVAPYAQWRIEPDELDSDEVRALVTALNRNGRLPRGGCPKSAPTLFDATKGLMTEPNSEAL